MIYPNEFIKRKSIDGLTGIKSSLNHLRSIVSLIYLLFLANNEKSSVIYGNENNGVLNIKPELLKAINSYLGKDCSNIIRSNNLFTSQFEALYVGITLMLKLGKLSFVDSSMSTTVERKGGIRYQKKIEFSTNILLLKLIVENFDDDTIKDSLYAWLGNNQSNNKAFERKVSEFLTITLQDTQFKIRTNEGNELFFQTEGIYRGLEKDSSVSIKDSKEVVGPTRIYRNFLQEGLDPWLNFDKDVVTLKHNPNADTDATSFGNMISTTLSIKKVQNVNEGDKDIQETSVSASIEGNERFIDALHSKPFLLLAGISGTGKSRKVQELAYATCPRDGALDADPTSPGNYCLIEVKPNWHDSTELLGYYSNISGKYMLTNFIRFVYKATQHPRIPFFVCLDEMNLAPVEQYFAEYLSVLETRKRILNEQNGEYEIRSAELISKKSFENIKIENDHRSPVDSYEDDGPQKGELLYTGEDLDVIRYIKENGLRLPENLFVIGTVNMDDTTHQFSRKVIDRAFTIEMNGGDLNTLFDEKDTLAYSDKPLDGDTVIPSFAKAQEVLDKYPNDAEQIKKLVPERLNRINDEGIFKNTPFRVSYRVENELILYFGSLRMLDNESSTEELVNKAFLTILLEKILPRVEGDEKAMNCGSDGNSKILKNLHAYIDDFKPEDYTDGDGSIYDIISHKLDEMNERVKMSYFTSFFS